MESKQQPMRSGACNRPCDPAGVGAEALDERMRGLFSDPAWGR